MEHYKRLQKAVDFIEKNIDNPISLKEVSKAAFSSLSYLHRVFYFMTGFTIKEYIRKRRFSVASYQLHKTNYSITQIGLNAGYETPEAFTRAFKKYYGLSPRVFRQKNQEQKLFEKFDILGNYAIKKPPTLDFSLNLDYVIYRTTNILGFQTRTTIEGGQQAVDICNFANKIMKAKNLEMHFNLNKTPIFGVYTNMTDENDFDYTIGCLENCCVKTSHKFVHHKIPTNKYAKFTLHQNDRIKEAWHYIYGSWFPQNDMYRARGLDFEIYHPKTVDIYIPIQSPN